MIEQSWYRKTSWLTLLLLPLTAIFACVAIVRRWLFKAGFKKSMKHDLPIIVVGNISVGGNGKTPFVILLAEYLQSQGKRIAIVSRGYGSKAPYYPYVVTQDASTQVAGDEPKLLFNRLGCPVVISPDRNAAVKTLNDVDVVISDDGMQHYQMARDVELCIVDGKRKFGNGWLMPSGPLREPISRLNSVDLVIENGGNAECRYELKVAGLFRVSNDEKVEYCSAAHVVSAIGNPQRFVDSLTTYGTSVLSEHFFADHHPFIASDFESISEGDIVMTEKDAVKCKPFAKANWYYLKVDAVPTSTLTTQLHKILNEKGILHGL